jgi:hypothetical protein
MNREQITTNIKLYSLLGVAQVFHGLDVTFTWLSKRCTDGYIYVTAKSTKYRR